MSRGEHQTGGQIWYGGQVFEDSTLEEFNEDCTFPLRDLLQLSPCSEHDSNFTYNFDDINAISQELGIPWERAKDHLFSPSAPYWGFEWNAQLKQVSMGEGKKKKYIDAIHEWMLQETHTLYEVQKLYGKLLHTCHIVPCGRVYLTKLEAMLQLCNNHPFKSYSHPK